MLRGIAPFMPPELIEAMMRMGHGDEMTLCDRNYPAATKGVPVIRCDGVGIPELLDEVLRLMPTDYAVDFDVMYMKSTMGRPPVWDEYAKVMEKRLGREGKTAVLEKPEFYERSRCSYVIVQTGESARFANVIVRKGVFQAEEK